MKNRWMRPFLLSAAAGGVGALMSFGFRAAGGG